MEIPFVGVIEMLKQVYGDDNVHTGSAVPASLLTGVERELGVTLPDDYKQFVQTWGYVCAGPTGNITVYGIASGETELDYEVDIRRATQSLRDEVAERAEDDEDLAAAVADAGGVVPAIGWAEDFPSHTVHVFDGSGALRWFLVKEHALDPASGQSFTEYLHEKVMNALEDRMSEMADAALGGASDAGDEVVSTILQMYPVPPVVVAALATAPGAASEIKVYSTPDELAAQVADPHLDHEDPDVAASNRRIWQRSSTFLEYPGVTELESFVGTSVDLFTGSDAMIECLKANETAALALRGRTLLFEDDGERITLLTPEEVRHVAAALDGTEDQLRGGYDADALRAQKLMASDDDNDDFLELIAGQWTEVCDAIRAAAESGSGWVIYRS